MNSTFQALGRILDAHLGAYRPEPEQPVWLSRHRWLHPADTDDSLGEVLAALAVSGRTCFLNADVDSAADLGRGDWREAGPGAWLIPERFDPTSFLQSQVHTEGNYFLYCRSSRLNDSSEISALPWWGTQRWHGRAARLRTGIAAQGIEIALAVHPDGSDWVLVLGEEAPWMGAV